jgi:hypothetical protein
VQRNGTELPSLHLLPAKEVKIQSSSNVSVNNSNNDNYNEDDDGDYDDDDNNNNNSKISKCNHTKPFIIRNIDKSSLKFFLTYLVI